MVIFTTNLGNYYHNVKQIILKLFHEYIKIRHSGQAKGN
jgi:hypothetical protein